MTCGLRAPSQPLTEPKHPARLSVSDSPPVAIIREVTVVRDTASIWYYDCGSCVMRHLL